MSNEMMRPCILPDYWETQEPLDALKVTGINCGAYSDKIELETIWEGKSCKLGDPVLLFDNLPEVKELIDSDVWDEFLELDPEDQEKIRVKYFRETVGIIHDALNAPVLAGKDVVKGLTKDMKLRVVLGDDLKKLTWFDYKDAKGFGFYESGHRVTLESPYQFLGEAMGVPFRIIADKNDPKTAEYLRQFTL